MTHRFVLAVCFALAAGTISPEAAPQRTPSPQVTNGKDASAHAVDVPPDYVIGPDDVLSIVFWRDKELTSDVVVRPDGMISVPLLNDLRAAGYTPEQLRQHLDEAAAKFIAEPNATVVVKAINSRRVFVTGNVAKPGTYPLTSDLTVLQLIAMAGGLLEYADQKNIVVIRKTAGADQYFKFNYKDVVRQKNVRQNIVLKPGDTVVVS
jgi:polysaccharide biosynthesis/export protein